MSKIKNKIIALIPARMGSSRFPGKPMAKINGIPMIEHVYRRVSRSKVLKTTYVATCDREIFNHMRKIGGNVIFTSKKHTRASDRCAEGLIKIEKIEKTKFDIVVMVQGDEPMTTSSMINQSIRPFLNQKSVNVVNLFSKFESFNEFKNPNTIKVIRDEKENAVYFTRNLDKRYFYSKSKKVGKQVCIIPFRRDYLLKFIKLKPTFLEILESIDMWRFLENNINVKMITTNALSFAVDHPSDINKTKKYLPNNY